MTSRLLFTFPVVVLFLFAALIDGCQKQEEPKETKPSVTIENLQTAYGKSMKRHKMYTLFVQQAAKERNKNIERMYRAIARSEEIHALNHARLLKSQNVTPTPPLDEPITVGTVVQTLKMATGSEEMEYDAMYPNLAKSAEAEKYTEAVNQFLQTRDGDLRHGELIKEALNKNGKIPKVLYFVCPLCGYILTSEKTETCPICQTKKDKFEKI